MKRALLIAYLLAGMWSNARGADLETAVVFDPVKDGYASIRIPALLTTQLGTLLAFAEGRNERADQAANQIIWKRSVDGGRTWEHLQLVCRDGENSLNNPCVVQERATGRILLMVQSYPAGGKEFGKALRPGLEGPAIVKNYLIISDDDGLSWTAPKDVTATTKAADAITIASGPGIGIQLQRGTHQGRLIVPFNQRVGPFWDVRAVYSDDRGSTWKLGEIVPGRRAVNSKGRETSMLNEGQMVELQDSSVLMNSRRSDDKPFRKTATSRDGGQTWSKIEQAKELADPACMGSILRYSYAGAAHKSIILYSGPNSTKRENGAVHVSYDEGRTWPLSKVLDKGQFGYSCLTRLEDGRVGILYETGKTKTPEVIKFARFPLDWLSQKDLPPAASQDLQTPNVLAISRYFTDHMVLQRDRPAAIWGNASPGAKVLVTFAGQSKSAISDRTGRWRMMLDPLSAEWRPRSLRVSSGNLTIEIRDLLVGDVWICAGQSNMEFPLAKEQHAAEELPAAGRLRLRLLNLTYADQGVSARPFTAEMAGRLTSEQFYRGQWQVSDSKSAADFSAVAYYFGKELQEKLDVPIGLIDLAVGGSPTEAWISRDALAADPQLKCMLAGNWLDNPALGEWCRQRGKENLGPFLSATTVPMHGDALGPNHAFKPAFLWEAGIAPLLPLTMRGVIWYQGESNSLEAGRVTQHERLFSCLVRDWRRQWGQGEFPFYFCQLSGIEATSYHAQYWPEFRDSQRRMAAELPNVGMAVTSDLGDRHDVHPRNKREVGRRLAILALARTYHQAIECDGPAVAYVYRVDQALRVRFDHAERGLAASDGKPLRGFEIAARQGEFHAAEAFVDGLSVELANRLVPDPARVRYAWRPFPDANLVNAAGLPASTFAAETAHKQ